MTVKKRNKLIFFIISAIVLLSVILFIIFKEQKNLPPLDTSPFRDEAGKLIVVTSLFPVYDFAKIVGGDKTSVSLILPSGSEAHAFLPTPSDLLLIKKSALFFYTSDLMESWASSLSKIVSSKTKVAALANGLNEDSKDPHVWLDFSKASLMVDEVLKNYIALDPENSQYYKDNASIYKSKLLELDSKFQTGLKDCQLKGFVSGGHFTFAYLAKRYNLRYDAAGSYIPSSQIDTEKISQIAKEMKLSGEPYIYYEEMIMPQLSVILRQETGAQLLPLNAAHNVGKHDIDSGFSFISIMENDLKILKSGLKCR